ncbi:hypothetical protein N0V93_008801 [Gnomoniopsis smithogilvyi]|uniref:Intradiol ring-cleavage dioxygenases domain-containing protein n=1 Tax=Gnomoniopsis smithogilvyi TaxID=1191159 RepID=A0A9W8YMC3_9PEZI|nr:hypothetical protein N0V93_008801 [Gnomoniopsis smithogilvyi]
MRPTILSMLAFAALSAAHPGHEEAELHAALSNRAFKSHARRSLDSCAGKLEARGFHSQAQERRAATWAKHSKTKKLPTRDLATVLNTSHHSGLAVTPTVDESELFSSNSTCIINPEGDVGPFYVLGEAVRFDLADGQPGIPLILEGQFLDVETCEPIEGLYWDLWNCNSTGVYAGIQEDVNGNGADAANLNRTFLRGIQATDADGVAQFHTVFPGHYAARTTHQHIIAHINATLLPNNTITGGNIAHVGQIFYDQDLLDAVEATYPYNTNTIARTANADDQILAAETEDSSSDPLVEYALLGDEITDGLFGWITIAVNVSASYDPTYRFARTASGGVQECGGSQGGGTLPNDPCNFTSSDTTGGAGNGTGPFGGSGTGLPFSR